MIAKLTLVDRVLMFSGVTDGIGKAARWVKTLATPADRYFGLAHADDPFTPVIFANWIALGMDDFGKPRKPEAGAPPYHGTHSLVTKLVPVDDDAHNSTAVDFKTPLGRTARRCCVRLGTTCWERGAPVPATDGLIRRVGTGMRSLRCGLSERGP